MQERARYIIGIDLGTTNSAVSYIDTDLSKNPSLAVQQLRILQLTGTGIVEALPVLPSFYYIADVQEFPYGSLCLPWDPPQLSQQQADQDFAVGMWAKDQGARVPTRLIQSAKSWLCNPAASRKEKILPFEAANDERKISPIEASAAFLRHIRNAWNHQIAKGNIADEFESQEIILTVPASFDEIARTLTIDAAKMAGFSQMTLLEEPQAAFYHWIEDHEKKWPAILNKDQVILVCDIGGGTTDFSLIQVQENQSALSFQRMAVGDHLLLGGDNMDAAICHYLENQLQGKELDINQWLQLKHQARSAKEVLLSGNQSEYSVWIGGKGSHLIEGSIQLKITADELYQLLVEGFFAQHSFNEALNIQKGSGIRAMGLPYEQEPSITKHLAAFLHKSIKQGLPFPSYILFNGGSTKPQQFQQAILKSLQVWQKELHTAASDIRILTSANLDLAVSKGAAYFGKVKRGLGIRIGGGSARAYYLGVDVKQADGSVLQQALTLLPRGVQEGTTVETDQIFQLLANTPVSFQLYSSHTRLDDHAGVLVDVKDEDLMSLPPLKTVLRFGKQKNTEETIPVRLGIHLSEIGTLEIWLNSQKSDHHWGLEFQLRSQTGMENRLNEKQILNDEIFEQRFFEPAKQIIEDTFTLEHRIKADEVMNVLEKTLERTRQQWPPSILRHLFDALIKQSEKMHVSTSYEARFWNLAGFFLRPGLGYPLDDYRIKELWKVILADFKKEKGEEVDLQKWICYRRIGAGLNKGQQTQLFNDLYAKLPLKKGKFEVKKPNIYQFQELIRTLASFEFIDEASKIKLGNLLVQRIEAGEGMPVDYWAMARIGARQLLYGSAANVVARVTCEQWVKKLTHAKGIEPQQMAFLLSIIARKTDQRELNLSQTVIDEIEEWIKQYPVGDELAQKLHNPYELTIREQEKIFGDSLPNGLVFNL